VPVGTRTAPTPPHRYLLRRARTVRRASASQHRIAIDDSSAGTQWVSSKDAATAQPKAIKLATTSYTGAMNRRLRTCATAITSPQAKVTDSRRLTTGPSVLARPNLGVGASSRHENEGMVHDPQEPVAFRLWPPVAIGMPLLVGWLGTLLWDDPVGLGGWRAPVGWALVLAFVVWNGWSLWLFHRHETGLLPGQATHAMIQEGPYRVSRNPLYVGLLGLYLGLALLIPTFWGLVLFPAAVLLVRWGAVLPEERFLHERFGAPYDDYTRRVRRWL
jgi:protein-S-isoprenylcysteine O-methyltransferase Ste14